MTRSGWTRPRRGSCSIWPGGSTRCAPCWRSRCARGRPGQRAAALRLGELAGGVLRVRAVEQDASGERRARRARARAPTKICAGPATRPPRGNPFYLRELARGLKRGRAAHGRGGPASRWLGRWRLSAAACSSRSAAWALTANGSLRRCRFSDRAPPFARRGAGGRLTGSRRGRCGPAARRGLLSAGSELAFVHPIVREAIAAELPPARGAELHARARAHAR